MDERGERRVSLPELVRIVERIDRRTEEIYDALFVERGRVPSIVTRLALLEQAQLDGEVERRVARVGTAIATLIGSAVGAAVTVISGRHS